jgi:DNA topoisomerase VI subunit B
VINALSNYRVEVSGRDERRAVEVREFLQREFGFEDESFEVDESLVDVFLTDEPVGDHEIQLTRAEAAKVVPALATLEANAPPTDAETVANLRDRFQETFDLEAAGGR